jgi:histone H3/H4
MPKKKGFLKFNSIKQYINDVKKMRSSTGAVKNFIKNFDLAIEETVADAASFAKADKRNTIMEEDVTPALEKHLGKKHLSWQETADEIIRQNPTDLGKISKAINDHIDKEKGESAK